MQLSHTKPSQRRDSTTQVLWRPGGSDSIANPALVWHGAMGTTLSSARMPVDSGSDAHATVGRLRGMSTDAATGTTIETVPKALVRPTREVGRSPTPTGHSLPHNDTHSDTIT